jgi:hypothetical protein
MQNIIAVIWDFDKTIVDGYMQDPIFKEYEVDASTFWKEVNSLPDEYKKQGVKVNPDTIYLNHFIRYTKEGKFHGLNNAKLREYGAEQKFYPGIPEIFKTTSELLSKDPLCKEYNIRVEHYIVSTGFAEVIRGTSIMEYVKNIWGCELIEAENAEGIREISEVGYTIDNTTKTRALFEINKGEGVNVNAKLSSEQRRVDFRNMIYIADGPSDVPAFSVVKGKGGATFAIYPKGNIKAFKQVEQLREDSRIDMFAEADYSDGTTASMWICNKIEEMAERMKKAEQSKHSGGNETPKHLV